MKGTFPAATSNLQGPQPELRPSFSKNGLFLLCHVSWRIQKLKFPGKKLEEKILGPRFSVSLSIFFPLITSETSIFHISF